MLLTNIIKKGELLDCYGELLTKRQRDCLDLYYNENLTLAEIAEHFQLSRQAVHDAMRHGEEQLAYYEKTLCLLYKKKEKQKALVNVKNILTETQLKKAEIWLELFSE